MVLTDIEIARKSSKKRIKDIAKSLNLPEKYLQSFGDNIAKIDSEKLKIKNKKKSKLILMTAITPTPAGEGKTTTSVGLTDGLCKIGKKSIVCLREPSLGPSFGMKGGAAGGGYSQVVPMEEINLHFTGDFHAITSANNLLASLIDNHIYWGNKLKIDQRRITWKRCIDLNDRALREITSNLGGVVNGFPRIDGFNITVASEVMAIFCLSSNIKDLERRLSNIIIGYTKEKEAVYAKDLNAQGAMTVLLKEALKPNLVQTLENNPAIIHGGPFANIAHGCNSLIATKTALNLADYVVTEAGFGADLGAEKFINIKCRIGNIQPDVVVIVATIRALKMHGGVEKNNLQKKDTHSVKIGMSNLKRHIDNMKKFGVPAIVAINHFSKDSDDEIKIVEEECKKIGVDAILCKHWENGGSGTIDLANKVVELSEQKNNFNVIYENNISLIDKIKTIVKEIYRADDVVADQKIRNELKNFENNGCKNYPICIAKTQYSFSTDPSLKGAPVNHVVPIKEVRLANGAEFIVVICGEIRTMPGLPSKPASKSIFLDKDGKIHGLF
ncbi:MAG: Formate--tetrahydrofolate ligase [Alphaproteobacteria bacterium MarineAlpha5_Bin9]|nr:MAG: Formate--tetrahydrofolate ligase [Alphaproteobacteria bacterium MarineAlpha5_Bin9]|tara:strand:- start:397 stop:2064 length:1668 start_codon:yes stop_codon:yes gene_type:complete